ncbi:hypothetical protein MCEMRE196_00533 [Candidatus Nanopelagicaceae bacterium]
MKIFKPNLPRMKPLLILFTLLFLAPTIPVSAADCLEKACIEVYTQDGHIVIEGRKGSGPKSTKVAVPAATKSAVAKPKARKTAANPQIPAIKTTRKPTVKKPVKKVATKKPTAKKNSTTATSLEDKLIESIPTAGISYQPSFSPLVQTPVFFWSDIPTVVTKRVEIVGEMVDVKLKPTFIWHYGDGVIYVTRKVGAPFPDGEIRHTYSKPGHYLIELITRWDGEFTVGGVSTPIPGEITTVSVLPITVVAAPIRFMN